MPIEIDDNLQLLTDDPRVDILVNELVSLTPIFDDANDAYIRGAVILVELDKLNLCTSQKKEVRDFIRTQWSEAAQKAEAAGVFSKHPTDHALSGQLLGLYVTYAGASLEVR